MSGQANILIDWVKVLRPTRHKIGHFRDVLPSQSVGLVPKKLNPTQQKQTRHRASTSMYSLTFCVRFLLPERHQRKPAVQAAAVMLRTPPVDGQSLASQPRPLPIYGAQFWECPQSPASSMRRPRPAGCSHYVVMSRDGRKLVTRVRVMMP